MKHLWHSPLEAGTIHGETDAGIKILGKGGRTKHVFVVEVPTGMKSPLNDPDGLYAATKALATCIERLTSKQEKKQKRVAPMPASALREAARRATREACAQGDADESCIEYDGELGWGQVAKKFGLPAVHFSDDEGELLEIVKPLVGQKMRRGIVIKYRGVDHYVIDLLCDYKLDAMIPENPEFRAITLVPCAFIDMTA